MNSADQKSWYGTVRPLAHGYVFRTSPLMNVYGSDFSHVQGFGVRDRYFRDFVCRAAGAKIVIYTRHPYAENNSREALDSVSTAKILAPVRRNPLSECFGLQKMSVGTVCRKLFQV